MQNLSKDLLVQHVFSRLECSGLMSVSWVCSHWRAASMDEALWTSKMKETLSLTQEEWREHKLSATRRLWMDMCGRERVVLHDLDVEECTDQKLMAAMPPGMNSAALELFVIFGGRQQITSIATLESKLKRFKITALQPLDIQDELERLVEHQPAYGGGFDATTNTASLIEETIAAFAGPCEPDACVWASGDGQTSPYLSGYWQDFYGHIFICLRPDGRTVRCLIVSDTD